MIINENLKMSKKSHHFLTLWPWPLTYDLEKLIRSGHYHYQCVYQIWEQSIPWFFSHALTPLRAAGSGRLRRKTITSPWKVNQGGIHIGSDSVLTWLTFQGRRSKVKVTASENDVIFSTFLNFHFLSHFPPKPMTLASKSSLMMGAY